MIGQRALRTMRRDARRATVRARLMGEALPENTARPGSKAHFWVDWGIEQGRRLADQLEEI